MRTGSEAATVEIVEHDEGAAHVAECIVRALGYQPVVFLSEIDFLKRHERDRRGCVLLDYAMPILSGLQVQALLSASGSIRPIIFASGMGTIPVTVTALRAGAVDFVTKPFSKEQIGPAIHTALEIHAQRERSIEELRHIDEKLDLLTPRELQVLELVVAGRLNKQIAAELGTVEKTIKVHRSRAMKKLGARSLAALVQVANAAGIGLPFGGDRGAGSGGILDARRVCNRPDRMSSAGSRGAQVGTWDWEIQDDRVIADNICRDLFGVTASGADDASLATYLRNICESDRRQVGCLVREAMATGEEFQSLYRVNGIHGPRTVLACGRVLFDSEGMAKRLTVAQVEITARMQRRRSLLCRRSGGEMRGRGGDGLEMGT